MKRIVFFLLSIMMLTGAANAQRSITVADGTETNSYVPIYGLWTDSYLRCQTIYPEELISEMIGGSILGIKYFLSSPASDPTTATFQIKIGTTTQASFSSSTFLSSNDFATVYTGSINLTTQTCDITFTDPYPYEGGNLVIEVNCITPADYSSTSFYGINSTGGSSQGYSSSSWSSVSGSTKDFIPKTEFNFQEGDVSCPTPTMGVPSVDETDVTISWTENGTATQYAIYLNGVLTEIVNNQTTYTFHGLDYITTYSAKVRAICAPDDTSYGASRSFTTPCGSETLPFNEGFEGFVSNNVPDCWTSMSGSNYVQANYASSGNNSLHIAGPGTILTPPLQTNGRAIEVSFSAKSEDRDDAGTIQVGFTTDAITMADVRWTTPIQPSDEMHHTYEVSFDNTGSTATGFVVFRQNAEYSYDYYNIDDIYVGVMSDCRRPQDITIQTVARTGAGISWTPPANGAPDAYLFEYRKSGTNAWTSQTVNEPYIFLTDLTLGTQYEVRVMSVCGTENSRDVSTTFRTPACDQEIGNGTETSTYVPLQGYYNYSYSQSLYLASELTGLDTIYGIAVNCSGTNSLIYTLDIYMANTTATSISTTDFLPLSSLTRVLQNHSINFLNGWNEISFSTPFVYNGTGNLVLAVDNNTGSYQSGLSFVHHASSGGSCYWYRDGSDITPSNPNESSSSNGNPATVPDIRFLISCAQEDCQAPLVVPEVLNAHEVALHWQPMTDETSWKVEYKPSAEQTWSTADANVTTTDYTLSNLAAGMDYEFRVSANCSGSNVSSTVTAFTQCDLFDVTYREDFSTGEINPCWAVSSTSYQYPTVVAGVLYTGNDGSTWVILPEFTEPLTSLMLTLTAQHSTETGSLQVGVTTGQEIGTFEQLDEFEYTTDITDLESYFDMYEGTGTNIALKFLSGYSNIDNIVVSVAPSCRKPTHIRVDEVDATTATLSWDAGDNATGAIVRYRRNNGSWNSVETTGNSVTLENLVANQEYSVVVKAICDSENSDNSKTFTFRTACADGSLNVTESYPFIEDFENGVWCWQQEFVSGELEWVTQNGDGESNMGAHGIDNAYQGRYNALLYNLLVYSSGPKTRLISPLLNTESLAEPYLKYSYGLTTYTDRSSSQSYTDEVSVYYRTDANSPWTPLNTHNIATTGWERDSVELPQTSTRFQISFLGYFKGGNGIAIDDVRIYTLGHDTRIDDQPTYTGIDDIEVSPFNVYVYPNPASGSTTVQINGANGAVTVAVMDMSGRTLMTEHVYCNEGCSHQVNLSGLAQGAYFVRVTGDQANTVRKLIVR